MALALSTSFAAPVMAEVTLTLGGSADFQVGHASQGDAFERSLPWNAASSELNEHGFANDTHIKLNIDGVADELGGLKYGGMIKLHADTSRSKDDWDLYGSGVLADLATPRTTAHASEEKVAEQTMLYLEGIFGRFEMGAYTGVTHAMQVDAGTMAHGAYGDAKHWWNRFTDGRGNISQNGNANINAARPTAFAFLQSANLPTNTVSRYGLLAKNANKINYYTPEWNGFMFGVSYTPDMSSHGTVNNVGSTAKSITLAGNAVNELVIPFRNVWEGGVHYQGQFNDVGVKAALLGQTGEAKDRSTGAALAKDLNAWEVGMNLSWQGWKVGGSYGSWGKSGQWKVTPGNVTVALDAEGKKTNYWTAALGYEYGSYGASLSYFESNNGVYNQTARNKLQTVSLGVDYKVAPGFMPYLDITYFDQDDKSTHTNNQNTLNDTTDDVITHAKDNDGFIILVGTKLQF